MIPFLIVNGILTGTGLEQPVVWYNPNEMIGLRLLSIPVEDVFYGLLMLIGSVTLFESRIKRSVHNAQL
jgi:lycopene cyclase domain-containing protein